MKFTKVLAVMLAFLAALSLAACGASTPEATEPTKKAYVYPGEDKQMSWHNPAYDKEEYADGAVMNVWVSASKDPERDYSYSGQIHWIENCNNHIFTLLCLPDDYDGSQKYPLLFTMHGYNSNFHEYDPMVKFFTDAGYAVLLFDFRGGHMSNLMSDGKLEQMSYDTKLSDVRAVLGYAETLPMVDLQNFILIGHSQGGAMAQIVAADEQLKDRFNGMLILAPAQITMGLDEKYAEPEDIPESKVMLYATVGRDYIYAAMQHAADFEKLPDYNKPVLVLWGTSDEIIPEEAVKTVADQIGDNAVYQQVEGGYHDFRDDVLPQLMPDTILPFLDSLLIK